MIEGVIVTPLKRIPGESGAVMHGLKKSALGYAGFGEAYFSEIFEGAAKGWRRHNRVTMNLMVTQGQVRFVLYDDRTGSRTRGELVDIKIGQTFHARLTVPPGIWMCFRGEGPGNSLILDIIEEEHDPAEAETCDGSAIPFSW